MEEENNEQTTVIAKEEEIKKLPEKKRKFFLHSALMPFLFWIVFNGLFYFFAYDLATINYKDITNEQITKIFSKYSIFTGLALGFISMLGGYIIYFISKKTKLTKFTITFPIIALLMTLPWYFFARQLVYFENKYTDIARGLIYYIGIPLLSTTKFLFWLLAIWLLIELVYIVLKKNLTKKATLMTVVIIAPLFLTGCVSNINEWACSFFDNPDHCLQNAAIQDANSGTCEKIEGINFKSAGSNPPQDKCYLRIAENTGDLDACNKIEGGPYSYTKEECILNTATKFKNPSGCLMLVGNDKANCISKVGPYIYPGNIIDLDDQIDLLKKELANSPDKDLQKQLDGLEKNRNDALAVISDKNKKEYESMSDPMNKQTSLDFYTGKIDEKTKESLVALNDSLRSKGEKLTDKEYETLSKMLAYKNDPKNDIENMDDTEILKLRWNEKMGNAVDKLKFWNSNPTKTEKKYDESLLFYERMLERQEAIDKGMSQQQQDFDRNAGAVKDYIKDKVYDAVLDEAKKTAFDELVDLVDSPASEPVTAVLGEAIDTVKKEAKSAEFRGLVRAYDMGMEEELAKAGGDVDKAHATVTANLQKDPYMYEDKNTFAKYGNVLENKDCDGTNPHCINKDIFWKAMKKSYKYQQK
ncbi:MAG: hypothetical protein COY69_01240 [Candidatus Magasanikbacteria bacterium CG_4_10_14_0_8_um_filter_32_14]|uniref:Uncharacterized protein n=1 Tax=Candidatus Magasanikbacteria bacterium CG_4_10_14_0_8_um_filter_32_14 TaxID=1974640 RepID=A0A2M7RAZ1_9BACT|nr:MAG: hypothetical protein COY69_01240 [Candidatus Magasanikbacteria bacterium CG_4_10_14_0_8_um_filter_32_14]